MNIKEYKDATYWQQTRMDLEKWERIGDISGIAILAVVTTACILAFFGVVNV